MEEKKVSQATAQLAREKGFNAPVNGRYHKGLYVNNRLGFSYDHNSGVISKEYTSAPTISHLRQWLEETHGIEVFAQPLFKEKCGYDSFRRDGFSYEVIRTEPCTYLDYTMFNRCGEVREEEDMEDCFPPKYETYNDALEAGTVVGLKMLS